MTSSATTDLDLTTHCDCGAVTLRVAGAPVSMLLCSCISCQKVSGTGHGTATLFPADSISTLGATKSHARSADSGATLTRYFCPECGTTLYAQSSRAPALRMVPAGLFAGQNDWFAPNQLIFDRSHPAWDIVGDHLPRHETYRLESKP